MRLNAPKASGGAQGFTLIELVVTVALLVIMLYMVAMIFTAAQRSFHDSRAAVEAHQTARAIFDMMRDEISAALLIRQGDGSRMLFEGVDDWNGNSDVIRFTTTSFQAARSNPAETAPGTPRVIEVQYYLEGDALMKRTDWDDDFSNRVDWNTDFNAGRADPAEGIGFKLQRIDFLYLDKLDDVTNRPQWTTDGDWPIDRGRLPVAVEVVITINLVDSAGRDFTETLSEIIYLPNSELQG